MSHLARLLRLGFVSLTLASIAAIAGGGCGGTAAQPQLTALNFPVFSVAYSLALDRIVILQAPIDGSGPQTAQLHLLDGRTLADDVIPLGLEVPQRAEGVVVTPDGTHAVVTLSVNPALLNASGAVVYVDLAARKVIETTHPIPLAPFSVVASNTTAYVLTDPGTRIAGPATIYSVDLRSGAASVVLSGLSGWSGPALEGLPRMALSPDGQTLYVCTGPTLTTAPDTLTSFAAEGAQLTQVSSVMPDVSCSSGLVTSRDGSRLYLAGTPEVLSANLSKISDASASRGGVAFGGLADPSNGQPVAQLEDTLFEGLSRGSALLLEDPSTFAVKSNTALPTLSADGGTLQPIGSGVFYDAAGTTRFVLVKYGDNGRGTIEPLYAIVSM
jgi:hypothetical protein